MTRACICVLLLGLLCVWAQPHEGGVEDNSHSRTKRSLFGTGGWFGSQNCGPPDACPTHACRIDDAVVHGYCCGCARLSDRVPVVCPPYLVCPSSYSTLCNDYNWMMDCCC